MCSSSYAHLLRFSPFFGDFAAGLDFAFDLPTFALLGVDFFFGGGEGWRGGASLYNRIPAKYQYLHECAMVAVYTCVRACVRVCVCVCVSE
jgi:hypothetical protein